MDNNVDKTDDSIITVAAILVVCAGVIGIGHKCWFDENIPVVEERAIVIDSVATDTLSAVPTDTLVFDTAEFLN